MPEVSEEVLGTEERIGTVSKKKLQHQMKNWEKLRQGGGKWAVRGSENPVEKCKRA